MKTPLHRRDFVIGSGALVGAAALPRFASALSASPESATPNNPYQYCTFIKYIQELSHAQLATKLKGMGFDGAEVTVRKGGYIAPEAAADELPKLAEVFEKHDMKINILTTDIEGPDSPNVESILATASKLGIRRYRMGFCRYDLTVSYTHLTLPTTPYV